eukprot:GEMP01030632.1.p1 GENE.GEMP01030632.1~~GEMP01030632.1.p1  ORF type:complete len:468 (+),score=72.69 GEMP01030632.1:54-1406(+)
MTFDKICRGSLIGEAHNKGLYVAPEATAAKRGTHVSNRSYKLETTNPASRRSQQRAVEPTQTFKTQNWFRHDHHEQDDRDPRVSRDNFSHRYWRQASGRSPAPAAQGTQFCPREKDNSSRLPKTATEYLGNGYPISNEESCSATKCQAKNTENHDVAPAEGQNPTFHDSVDWMTYSTPRDHVIWARTTKKQKDRLEYLKKKRSTSMLGDGPADVVITNSVDNVPSKGKKSFPSNRSDAAKLLEQDPSHPMEKRSERKHAFDEDPQGQDLSTGPANTGLRSAHRSSQEVHEALSWDEKNRNGNHAARMTVPSKVVVGGMIRSSDVVGRRSALGCIGHAENNTLVAAAGASPRGPARSGRDHRNSDAFHSHMSVPNLETPQSPVFGNVKYMNTANEFPNKVYSYPSGSMIPSILPKSFAYAQGQGLRPCKNRALGLFSPITPFIFNPTIRQR